MKRDLDLGHSGTIPAAPSVLECRSLNSTPRRSLAGLGFVGGALIVIAAALGYVLTRARRAAAMLCKTVQLTNSNQQKSGIVTDGSRLYFIEEQSQLSQVSVAGGETVPVPNSLQNTGFANLFDISRDGSSLLMNTALGTSLDGPLWSVPVLGGSPRRLGNLKATPVPGLRTASASLIAKRTRSSLPTAMEAIRDCSFNPEAPPAISAGLRMVRFCVSR